MIDPKELRIGNCVRLYLNHSDYSEFPIELADLNLIVNKGGDYFPIPLTPEILEKCGFDRINDFFSIRIDEYIWFHLYEGGIYGFWSDSIENECNFTLRSQDNRIQYLHQLQNLYFSLTGEELEIKELQHA